MRGCEGNAFSRGRLGKGGGIGKSTIRECVGSVHIWVRCKRAILN